MGQRQAYHCLYVWHAIDTMPRRICKAEELPGKSKGVVYDAKIYFPVTIEPATDSRIRITKMAGRTLEVSITFAIVGIEKHPHCIKCICSEVKGATAQ
jgi:hypothetical protein